MKTVLFIEDESGQRELTTIHYQMFGKVFHGEIDFLSCATWKEGLKIIRSRAIDVLILDLILAKDGMDRRDTLRAIKETPDLPPVIVFTGAEDDKFLRDKCIMAGADDFMLKHEANHNPQQLCEKAYLAFLRRQRDLIHGKRA